MANLLWLWNLSHSFFLSFFLSLQELKINKCFLDTTDFFSGGATLPLFASLLNGSQRLKEKNLLPKEQILSFKSRPHSVRALPSSQQTGSHKSCSPLIKGNNNIKMYPDSWNCITDTLLKQLLKIVSFFVVVVVVNDNWNFLTIP